jgi:hypothetical protein
LLGLSGQAAISLRSDCLTFAILYAGTTAVCFRLAMKLMDYNLMATITALLAPVLPDFKKAMKSKKAS